MCYILNVNILLMGNPPNMMK